MFYYYCFCFFIIFLLSSSFLWWSDTDLARPLKNLPMAMTSSWSEQLKTTHWMANALPRSCTQVPHRYRNTPLAPLQQHASGTITATRLWDHYSNTPLGPLQQHASHTVTASRIWDHYCITPMVPLLLTANFVLLMFAKTF